MQHKWMARIALTTLILVYLVILAGSVVRSSGSGMGCPDWPKCFGSWIPPTDQSQLPEDYQEDFAKKRCEKLDKFIGNLEFFSLDKEADKIRNQPEVCEKEESFNATKTWIEYVNRLFGFLAGNFMLLQFILAIWWRKVFGNKLLLLSFINLIFIGFQAWFGSIVVATNLLPWTITIHMFFALLIVALQITILQKVKPSAQKAPVSGLLKIVGVLTFILTIVQIYFGTQIRQQVDILLSENNIRSNLIEMYDISFYIHRSFSWIILGLNVWLVILLKRRQLFNKLSKILIGLLLTEVVIGVFLAFYGLPAWLQPLHMLIACIVFGIQFYIIYRFFEKKREPVTSS